MAYGVVYKITNVLNGKGYVGQTTKTPEQRFKRHANCKTSLIGKAIRKYGRENFTVEVLEECDTPEQLNAREIFWIAELNCKAPIGYNCTDGGDGRPGFFPSAESRAKMSAAHRGKKHSAESRAKIGMSNKGKHHTAETRLKMSAAHKGKKHSAANKGKTLSAEHRAKMSAAHMGKHHTAESQAKMSAAHRSKTSYKNLLAEMDKHPLSYTALAKLMGLSPQSVSLRMRGKQKFKAKDIAKLEEIFGLSAEYLMARDD